MSTSITRFLPKTTYALAADNYLLFEGQPGLALVAGRQPDAKRWANTLGAFKAPNRCYWVDHEGLESVRGRRRRSWSLLSEKLSTILS